MTCLASKDDFRLVGKTRKSFRQIFLVLHLNEIWGDFSSIGIEFVEKLFDVLSVDVALPFDVADQFADFSAVARR